jgi:hypothetical protein
VKTALGSFAFGLNVPVPPETTDHVPVPTLGALPPREEVVPSAQIAWSAPTVAGVGWASSVIVTSAEESAQGGFEIVQRRTTGPAPEVLVKMAFGSFALGLNVPEPPETTDHVPVPTVGVLPPRPDVDPSSQIA